MKLLDANILLYAYDKSATHHESCRVWLESVFNAAETLALPWQTILAFVRISTNPRAVKHPLSNAHACDIVVTMERPAPDSQCARITLWIGKDPAAQSRIRMGAGDEEPTIRGA